MIYILFPLNRHPMIYRFFRANDIRNTCHSFGLTVGECQSFGSIPKALSCSASFAALSRSRWAFSRSRWAKD